MSTIQLPPIVFISYGDPDRPAAESLYRHLSAQGLTVWFDKASLLPGQRWQHEISKAIRRAEFVILLLSSRTVSRRGYFHREMSLATEVLQEVPPDQIYLVPARLNECEVPESIRHIHWVDLFPDWDQGVHLLDRALTISRTVKSQPVVSPARPKSTVPAPPVGQEIIDKFTSEDSTRWFRKFRTDILLALIRDLEHNDDRGLAPKEAIRVLDALLTIASVWARMPHGSFLEGGGSLMERFADLFRMWDLAGSTSERKLALTRLRKQRAKIGAWSRNNQQLVATTLDYEAVRAIISEFQQLVAESSTVFPNLTRALNHLSSGA